MRDKDNSKEKTVVLNNRDIVLMFAFFVVVLVVVFTIGLMVGRSFTEPMDEPALAGQPAGAGDKAPAPAGAEPSPAIEEITLPPPRDDTTRAGVPPAAQPTTQPAAVATPPAKPATPTTAPTAAGPKPAPTPAPTQPVPPPATPAAPAVAGTTYFVVQAMATRDLAEACQMVDRLKGKGYDAFVKIADAGSGDGMHRVQVGKFKDQAHARELVARLKKDGFEAFPRKVTE